MRERVLNVMLVLLLSWWSITLAHDFIQPVESNEAYIEGQCLEKTNPAGKWVPCGESSKHGLDRHSCEAIRGLWIEHRNGCLYNHHLWRIRDGEIVIEYYIGKIV